MILKVIEVYLNKREFTHLCTRHVDPLILFQALRKCLQSSNIYTTRSLNHEKSGLLVTKSQNQKWYSAKTKNNDYSLESISWYSFMELASAKWNSLSLSSNLWKVQLTQETTNVIHMQIDGRGCHLISFTWMYKTPTK